MPLALGGDFNFCVRTALGNGFFLPTNKRVCCLVISFFILFAVDF